MSTKDLLRAHFTSLQADRAALLEKTKPFRAAIDKAEAGIQKLKEGTAKERTALKAANAELALLDDEISKLAFALGGKRLSDG
jgi:uncharacterized phage infection (PIP) family protein YhgE